MWHYLRFTVLTIGVICVLLAFGFAFQLDWATRLWPWPDSRLSYIFIGSILAAIGAPSLWIAFSGELGAIAGGALNIATIATAGGVYMARLYVDRSDGPLLASAIVLLVVAAGSVTLYLDSRSIPIRDQRPIPFLVRISFGAFVAILGLVSLALLRHAAHIFPWPLRADTSVMIGAVFLGSAVYFIYGLSRRYWGEATAHLIGFLAYDLVLIGPFMRHFGKVQSAHRLSLILYVLVLVASGALATYYLFIASSTRIWGEPQDQSTKMDTEPA